MKNFATQFGPSFNRRNDDAMKDMIRGYWGIGIIITFVFAAAIFARPSMTLSQVGSSITGYAWSDTIGWISLNCTTGGATGNNICASSNYGLAVDSSGFVTGYAWSDNIGWIKFGGLSGFPAGAGTSAQNAQISSNNLIGWARACGGTTVADCSAMTSRTDGWDGWIAFNGTGYGVTLNAGVFAACQVGSTSCAWGDVNVGWIDFSNAATTYGACASLPANYCDPSGLGGVSKTRNSNCEVTQSSSCPWQCEVVSGLCIAPPQPQMVGGGLVLSPSVVRSNGTTTVSWTVQDAQTCQVNGENGDIITVNPSDSEPITITTQYVLTCTDVLGAQFIIDEETVSVAPAWQEL